MAFIIMNLLVGLTVNKIEELIKTGEKIQASKRVEDIHGMAKILYQSRITDYFLKVFCLKCMPIPIMKTLEKKNSTKVISKEKF